MNRTSEMNSTHPSSSNVSDRTGETVELQSRSPGLLSLAFMPLLWVLPARIGAYNAKAGWTCPIAAHFFAIAYSVGIFLYLSPLPVAVSPMWPPWSTHSPSDMEWIRGPLCTTITDVHERPGVLLYFAACEAGLLLVATLIMGLFCRGERRLSLFGRSVKLVLWSTTVLLPATVAFCLYAHYSEYSEDADLQWPRAYMAIAALIVWWFVVLLRSGSKSPLGRATQSLQEAVGRCIACGYTVANLPNNGDCPECGRAIADSLSECRRVPAYACTKSLVPRFLAFFRTMYAAMLDQHYFQRLACRQGHAYAVRYLTWLCLLNSLISPPVAAAMWVAQIASHDPPRPENWYAVLLLNALWFVLLHLLAGFVALIVSIFGRRPLRQTAVVTCYAMSILTPVTIWAVFVSWSLHSTIKYTLGWTEHVLLIVVASIGVTGFVVSLLKIPPFLRRAYRDTRFANA